MFPDVVASVRTEIYGSLEILLRIREQIRMRLVLTCFEITSGESAESLVTSMSICGTTSGSSSSSESDSSWSFLSFSSPGMFSGRSRRMRVSRVSSRTTDSIWRIYGTKHVQTDQYASRRLPYRTQAVLEYCKHHVFIHPRAVICPVFGFQIDP
jgi:hypothetical protein